MASFLSDAYDLFWDERWWFGSKINGTKYGWKDLENTPGSDVYFPKSVDLHGAILLGVFIVVLRYFLDKYVIYPLGYYLGIKRKRPLNLPTIPALETLYKHKVKPDSRVLQGLSKQLDMSENSIQKWFRIRQKIDRVPMIKKFADCCSHFIFYSIAFIYGLVVLWDKTWLWETGNFFPGWPKQHVVPELYYYYQMELGFYWGLIFTLCFDHRRKDFMEMIIHHIATMFLIYFSWQINFVRTGSLVLFVHDAADPWLALSKATDYLKWDSAKTVCFVTFLVVWISTRLVYFPFWVLHATTFGNFREGQLEQYFPVYFVCNVLLYTLMVLHLFWSYSIGKIAFKTLEANGEIKDIRSDFENDSDFEKKSCNVHTTNDCNGNAHDPCSNGNVHS
ncbi:ceramide synthase 2-like [Mya arenaria]|uniref:ceramide synthase 2-like n=1 Tax=Mya arenaria TaxID=6604 RepID=UPI0022E6D717|nr:ceramide synthase 2-like [Mya arenaria]XP_052803609.1 ceramide synthase 2-like [Mya arenaria]